MRYGLDGFTKESNAYADFKQIYRDGQYTNETMLQEILHYAGQYHTFYFGDEKLSEEINTALSGLRKLNQTTYIMDTLLPDSVVKESITLLK